MNKTNHEKKETFEDFQNMLQLCILFFCLFVTKILLICLQSLFRIDYMENSSARQNYQKQNKTNKETGCQICLNVSIKKK